MTGRGSYNWVIVGALFLAEMTAAFETSMIYAALPKLNTEFGDAIMVGWLVTAYLLIGAATAAATGRLGDIYGRRRVTLIVLAIATLGSLMSALAESFAPLLIGRGLQGVAAALLPLTFGLVRENLPPKQVPMGVGLMTSAASAGAVTGLIMGGLMIDRLEWNSIFWASAFLSIISFVAVWLIVPKSPSVEVGTRPDWIGCILFVPAISSILLAISKGGEWGWGSPLVLGLFAAGAVISTIWVRRSLHATEPFIEIRLLADPRVLLANLIVVFLALGALQITLAFSVLMQTPTTSGFGLGLSATMAGIVKTPSSVFASVAGAVSGWLAARHGSSLVIMIGGLLLATGWAAAAVIPLTVPILLALLCLISFGTGLVYASVPNVLLDAVPVDRTSEASGVMSVFRVAGLAIGAQIVVVLLATSTIANPTGGGSYPSPDAFRLTFAFVTAMSLCIAVLAIVLRRLNQRRTAAASPSSTVVSPAE
ncbi:MAG: MFS transporter [Sphingobium sp.]